MDCTANEFCSSLSDEARAKLCSNCKRHLEKAGGIQLYSGTSGFCMIVLDGALCSNTAFGVNDMDHSSETPSLYLALPGWFVTNLDLFEIRRTVYEYSSFRYLTDTWVATLDFQTVRELFQQDPSFVRSLAVAFVKEHETMCQVAAFVRTNFAYFGTYHFMKLFESHGLYVTQQNIASIMNHDRSSISKAMKRIQNTDPELWSAYMANKRRKPSIPNPQRKAEALV